MLACPLRSGVPLGGRLALLGIVTVGALVACGGDAGDVDQVLAVDDAFSPVAVEIPAGGSIEWLMAGDNPHNVVAADRSWQSADTMSRGDKFTRVFDQPGVFAYFCTFHGTAEGEGMAGSVIVGDVPDYQRPQPVEVPVVAVATGVTRAVPADYATIQAAVDAADPGDLVLVAPGLYHEAVVVRTPSLVIRGADRNATVLDGEFTRSNGIHVVADGVALENMTARNYEVNGFYWTGVTGYRGSWLTAHNNGDYGIYAFGSVDGLFEESYASANRDSGFYIGQCFPCNAVVRHVTSEANGLAWSGTNAGGDLYVIESLWRNNMAGLAPNSLDSELDPPHQQATVVGNLVIDNNNKLAPAIGFSRLAYGTGIVAGGGVGDVIERNLVLNHDRFGIVAAPLPDQNIWWSQEVEVRDNVVAGSGLADIFLVGPWGPGNCFEGNLVETSWPVGLQTFHRCDGLRLPLQADLSGLSLLLGATADAAHDWPPGSDYRTYPAPGPQPQMPSAAVAPVRPAVDVFERPDLDAIPVPELPAGLVLRSQEVTVSGIPVSEPTLWTLIFSMYAFYLPVVLYAAWVAVALWDLVRRTDLRPSRVVMWVAVILLIPLLGPVAYYTAGRSQIPAWLRGVLVGGGIGAYLVILTVAAFLGGVV
jgi:plastocyanin